MSEDSEKVVSFREDWVTAYEHSRRCEPFLNALHLSLIEIGNLLEPPKRKWSQKNPTERHFFDLGEHWFLKDVEKRIYLPSKQVQNMQSRILNYLCFGRNYRREYLMPSIYATAYIPGRSGIILNAEIHKQSKSSLHLDLHNAFEQIRTKHIYRYLKKQKAVLTPAFNDSAAWLFARLLSYQGRLRKGALASPTVFNLLMTDFDNFLQNQLSKYNVRYSRYGDDFCFSSEEKKFPAELEQQIISWIIKPNWLKSVLNSSGIHQYDFPALRLNFKKIERGSNGVLLFPGTIVINGTILPKKDWMQSLSAKIWCLNEHQFTGSRGFLMQFPKDSRRLMKKRFPVLEPLLYTSG